MSLSRSIAKGNRRERLNRETVPQRNGSETTSSFNRVGIAPRVRANLSRPVGHAVKREDQDASFNRAGIPRAYGRISRGPLGTRLNERTEMSKLFLSHP